MPLADRSAARLQSARAWRASAAGSFPAVTVIGRSCRVRRALTRPILRPLLDEGAAGRAGTASPTRLEAGPETLSVGNSTVPVAGAKDAACSVLRRQDRERLSPPLRARRASNP